MLLKYFTMCGFFRRKNSHIALIFFFLTACHATKAASKQTLRLNIYSEPPTLDSRKATDSTSMNVLLNLFEGLTRIGEDHLPYPAAAKKIEISNDGRTYTFILRESYWTNGERVSSRDFLHAWQTMLDPKFPSLFAYKLYVIENAAEIKDGTLPMSALGVSTPNDYTLRVTLKHPTPYFLELTAFPTFFPINKAVDKKNPEWSAESGPDYTSNGPFQLTKWEHDSEIILEKNPYYWDSKAVKLATVHLAMIDDTTTEFYMFEMDELDWAGSPLSNLPPEFIAALRDDETKQKFQPHFYPATAVYYYKINTHHYPLMNLNIRRALAYSINRDEIVDHVTQGGQSPATALVPPMPGWKRRTLFEDGNSEVAKRCFAEGLKELSLTSADFPILTLTFNTNQEHQKIAQAVQQQWKEILGINVELVHFDWKVYLNKISNQDYQIARMGWIGDFHDPVSFLAPFKFKNDPQKGGNNDTGWEHPQFIDYLNQAEKELNLEKRAEILHKAEDLIISELPVIPLYFIVNGYLKKSYVHGVYLSPLGMADLKKAYIK